MQLNFLGNTKKCTLDGLSMGMCGISKLLDMENTSLVCQKWSHDPAELNLHPHKPPGIVLHRQEDLGDGHL